MGELTNDGRVYPVEHVYISFDFRAPLVDLIVWLDVFGVNHGDVEGMGKLASKRMIGVWNGFVN